MAPASTSSRDVRALRRLKLFNGHLNTPRILSETGPHEVRLLTAKHARFGAEPLLVPKDGSTDEGVGWVLVCVNDRGGGPAELVVLDGEDLAAEPVARIHLPRRVPDGFHGNWVPDSSVPPE